jgi:exosome complex RNA-binding protein Rrp42 (RNase PH superfamily)
MADINKFHEERDGCKSVMNKHKYANLSNYNSHLGRAIQDFRQISIQENNHNNINNSRKVMDTSNLS